ncbi:MAG: thiolase family protein [Planctomycetota bacterium]|jgi:acetyl-CoA C-acetyltransferase
MTTNLNDIVCIGAARTPMGRFGGSLKDVPSYELGGTAIKAALERAGVSGDQVSEAILGMCRQAGNGPNPARSAVLKGGLADHVPAQTINMACPSGMVVMHHGVNQLRLGNDEFIVAGGFDSMSTIPYLIRGCRFDGLPFMGKDILEDGWTDSVDPIVGVGMGGTAENLADKYPNITREMQDDFAAQSHIKASRAQKEGLYDAEIASVTIPAKRKQPEKIFDKDETIRHEISGEKMAKLKPSFRKDGCVTAGNACGLSDGACAVVLTTREKAKAIGATPLFSILGYAQTAVDNAIMGIGPSKSIPMALEAAGMSIDSVDLAEINEAFAIQVLSNVEELKLDPEKLNVHGGAIALGHPTGISGCRIVITGYYAMKALDKETLVAGICGGTGVTSAIVIKRES